MIIDSTDPVIRAKLNDLELYLLDALVARLEADQPIADDTEGEE